MRTRYVVAPAVLALLVSCIPQPVAWDAERPLPNATPDAAIPVDAAGRVALAPARPASTYAPPDACPNSVRVAVAAGQQRYAAWWAPRADSSAWLLAAHSSDGGASWPRAYVVDSLDRGTRGCRRPAPAIAADSTNGYVHVAYALDAPEGSGLFYAHLMDPRARFEIPVAVVYGDRTGATAVASDDQTVAIAYENPNSGRPQIALAVSRTAGHTFESKSIAVSGTDTDAAGPGVALRGTRIAVSWTGQGERMVREGRVK